jgi:hypothetical protein
LNDLQIIQDLSNQRQLVGNAGNGVQDFGDNSQELLEERVQLNNQFSQEAFKVDAVGDFEKLGKLSNDLKSKYYEPPKR